MNLPVAGEGSCVLLCWKVAQINAQQIKKAFILPERHTGLELRQTQQRQVEKTAVSGVHGLDAPVSAPGRHL